MTVKFAHHGISGVRDDSAEDTSQIAGSECNSQLGGLRVVLLAKGEDVVIEELDKPFESDELDNSVWDLTRPERDETLVEA